MEIRADASERFAVYNRLARRNRIVSVLRLAVPIVGALALLSLLVQIYLANTKNRFDVANISISADGISVLSPVYTGVLDDGTTYKVTAESAFGSAANSDQIELTHARLVLIRLTGDTTTIDAEGAVLDTRRELVEIADVANVVDSKGNVAVIRDSVFDYARQALVGRGLTEIDYEDGTDVVAQGMTYDVATQFWTFINATVTLPDTPGAKSVQ
jgi:lipopolysaccharide export system protein LptC